MKDWYDGWEERLQPDPDELAPFNFNRLYGQEKYSLQNMVLKAVNCPDAKHFKGEAFDVWSDRVSQAWSDAARLVQSTQNADAFFAGATDESFMAFARKMSEVVGFGEITGARVVRYTDAGGYPSLRLDLVRQAGRRKK